MATAVAMDVEVTAVGMDVEATAVVTKVEAKARAHARDEHHLSEPMARADARHERTAPREQPHRSWASSNAWRERTCCGTTAVAVMQVAAKAAAGVAAVSYTHLTLPTIRSV